jgi:ribosomal protein S30
MVSTRQAGKIRERTPGVPATCRRARLTRAGPRERSRGYAEGVRPADGGNPPARG